MLRSVPDAIKQREDALIKERVADMPVPLTKRRYHSVAAVANEFGISECTLYRAIQAGEFPALKIRGRYVIPASVLDAMEATALSTGVMVDTADWVENRGAA